MQNIKPTMNSKLDLLEPHAEQLARMKDQNQSTAEILAWLRTQCIHKIHGGHLAALWKRREAKSQNATNFLSPPSQEGDQSQGHGSAPDEVTPHPSHPSYVSHGSAYQNPKKMARPSSDPPPMPLRVHSRPFARRAIAKRAKADG